MSMISKVVWFARNSANASPPAANWTGKDDEPACPAWRLLMETYNYSQMKHHAQKKKKYCHLPLLYEISLKKAISN